MAYVQKNSPLKQAAKFMTMRDFPISSSKSKTKKTINAPHNLPRNFASISKPKPIPIENVQSSVVNTAVTFAPIPGARVLGGIVKGAKKLYNMAKGSKKLQALGKNLKSRPTTNAQTVYRVEDANYGTVGTAGTEVGKTGYQTGGFFGSVDDALHYVKKTKAFNNPDKILSPEAPRRLIAINLTKNAFKQTQVGGMHFSTTANKMSGGGTGFAALFSETVLPKGLTNVARNEKTKWSKAIIGNAADIKKYLNTLNK